MMMSAGAMNMAVGDFLGTGFAHLDDFDGEMQGFSGQRMIAVDGDFVLVDLGDDHGDRALPGLRLELHADGEVVDALKDSRGTVCTSSSM